jgi:flavodoxin
MKILIAYHSNTKNTEKVANAIKEVFEEEGKEVTMLPAKDVDPSGLNSYDFIILGSGIYSRTIGRSIKALMKKATGLPPQIACFQTYQNETWYPKAFTKAIGKTLEKYNSTIIDEFGCWGYNLGMTDEQMAQLASSFPPEEKKRMENQRKITRGHPNEEDCENAKIFAKDLLKKI